MQLRLNSLVKSSLVFVLVSGAPQWREVPLILFSPADNAGKQYYSPLQTLRKQSLEKPQMQSFLYLRTQT